MRYNDIFTISILIIIIFSLITLSIIKFIKSSIHIILIGDIENNININLNIKYLFNLINIKIPLYPTKSQGNKSKKVKKTDSDKEESKDKKKKKIKDINMKAVEIEDIKIIYKLVLNIKIEEIYSDINFGNENIHFTCFIYIFINTVYGNIINFVNPEKIYLKVTPNFTHDYIMSKFKIHVKPTIKDIISIFIAIVKIYKKVKKRKKDGGIIEINRVNKKSYGDNI